MIISLPLSLLHALLFSSTASAKAAFQCTTPISGLGRLQQTRIYAEDPYANLLNKVAPSTTSVTPITTPPEPLINIPTEQTQDTINDIIQQINEVASSAIDAAGRADQAAASIAAPAAALKTAMAANASAAAAAKAAAVAKAQEVATAKAAAKAAALAAGGTAAASYPEKVPTLIEYIGRLGTQQSVESGAGNLSEIQEKLSILQSNFIKGFSSLGDAAGTLDLKLPVVSSGATDAGMTYTSADLQVLIDNLQLDQYGAWYVTAASLLYATGQKQAGKEAAEKMFENELTNAKLAAQEAAAAAAIAAEGAKAAKEMVKNIPKPTTDNKILMETRLAEIALDKVCTRMISFDPFLMISDVSDRDWHILLYRS